MGLDAYFLEQHKHGRLKSSDSLCTITQICMEFIPSADEALRDLGTFSFAVLHLFSAGGTHEVAITEILRLIENMEDLHTNTQGMITPLHLAKTLMIDVYRRRSLYLNRCGAASSSKDLGLPRATATFSIDSTPLKFEGGR